MPDVPKIVFSYYLNWLNERIGKNWRVTVINLTIFDLASGEVDDLVNERRINYGAVKYIFCINSQIALEIHELLCSYKTENVRNIFDIPQHGLRDQKTSPKMNLKNERVMCKACVLSLD